MLEKKAITGDTCESLLGTMVWEKFVAKFSSVLS